MRRLFAAVVLINRCFPLSIATEDASEVMQRAMCHIKDALHGPGITKLKWTCTDDGLPANSGSVCTEGWSLVECDESGFITHINLYGQKLTGSISSYVGDITTLTYLVFQKNSLTGTIPTEIGNLEGLFELGLAKNILTGTIPTELGNLVNLENALELYANKLNGKIPTELGLLTKVSFLLLQLNSLTGSVPSSICNMEALQHLRLDDNKDILCYPQCVYDAPNGDYLTHIIEKIIDVDKLPCNEQYSNICGLYAGFTNAAEALPEWDCAAKPANMDVCSFTPIECDGGVIASMKLENIELQGSINSYIGSLTGLTELSFVANTGLGLSVPSEIGLLTNLERLSLAQNDFTGTFPVEVEFMTTLKFLDISSTQLADPLPYTIGYLTQLEELVINNDLFTALPEEVCLLTSLTSVSLMTDLDLRCVPSCLVHGGAPPLINLIKVEGDVRSCETEVPSASPSDSSSGEEPTEAPVNENTPTETPVESPTTKPSESSETIQRAMCHVQSALVGHAIANWKCGDDGLPVNSGRVCTEGWSFIDCDDSGSITDINLYGQKLTGSISSYVGDITTLTYLVLQKNSLTGTIPTEIGNLEGLFELGLAKNSLTGTIPTELGNLVNLENAFEVYSNKLNGKIPTELGLLTKVAYLLLNSNSLTGSVPSSICNMEGLQHLRLDDNKDILCYPQCVFDAPHGDYLTNIVDKYVDTEKLPCNEQYSNICGLYAGFTNAAEALPEWDCAAKPANMDVCSFTPIECDGGVIASIKLESIELQGSINTYIGSLTGLTELSFVANAGLGLSIPSEIGLLMNLERLSFAQNDFTGTFPVEIEFMTTLKFLDISSTQLADPLPYTIGYLTQLEELVINNDLFTALPEEVCLLTSLTSVSLMTDLDLRCVPSCLVHGGAPPLINLITYYADLPSCDTDPPTGAPTSLPSGVPTSMPLSSAPSAADTTESPTETPSVMDDTAVPTEAPVEVVEPTAVPTLADQTSVDVPTTQPVESPVASPVEVTRTESPTSTQGTDGSSSGRGGGSSTSSGNQTESTLVVVIIVLAVFGCGGYYMYSSMSSKRRSRDFNLSHIKGLASADDGDDDVELNLFSTGDGSSTSRRPLRSPDKKPFTGRSIISTKKKAASARVDSSYAPLVDADRNPTTEEDDDKF